MLTSDGSSPAIEADGSGRKISCTRWVEMCDAIKFHAELADIAKAPSEFIFLNATKSYIVGKEEDDGVAKNALIDVLDGSPGGATPLCQTISNLVQKIKQMEKSGKVDFSKVKLPANVERFLNRYRNTLPDIDFDFPHTLRDNIFYKLEKVY